MHGWLTIMIFFLFWPGGRGEVGLYVGGVESWQENIAVVVGRDVDSVHVRDTQGEAGASDGGQRHPHIVPVIRYLNLNTVG